MQRKSEVKEWKPAGPGDLITFDEFDVLAGRVDGVNVALITSLKYLFYLKFCLIGRWFSVHGNLLYF